MSGIWELGKIWWMKYCSSYNILCRRWLFAESITYSTWIWTYFERVDVRNLIYASKWTKLIIYSRRCSFALFIPNCGALIRWSMRYCSIIEFGDTSLVETIHGQFCIRNLSTLKLVSVSWEFWGHVVYPSQYWISTCENHIKTYLLELGTSSKYQWS